MEDGQLNNLKVGYIIQARMGSTRLPAKVLAPVPPRVGKPVIEWISENLKLSRFNGEIIVASSAGPENDVLEKFCIGKNIHCFRGDEDNVLSRFVHLTELNSFDVVVRLTGDNPILDVSLLDQTIQYHLDEQNDYTYTKGLPIGMNLEVVSAKPLLELQKKKLKKLEREHVTLHIRDNDDYKQSCLTFQEEEIPLETLRLTMDYPSDFTLLSTVFSYLPENQLPNLELIKRIWKDTPWIFESNKGNFQKRSFESESEEIEVALEILERYEFERVVKILKSIEESKRV